MMIKTMMIHGSGGEVAETWNQVKDDDEAMIIYRVRWIHQHH